MSIVGEVIHQLVRINRSAVKQIIIQSKSESRMNHVAAELIRNTHSIEKGLSISSPRLGFGHVKQKEMMKDIGLLENKNSLYYQEVCQMAATALKEYAEYHQLHGFTDDIIVEILNFLDSRRELFPLDGEKHGGTLVLDKSEILFDEKYIEKFFLTRHSVRDFADSEVDVQKLNSAIRLAQRAPSACNRQAVGIHVINGTDHVLRNQLEGIGGFENEVAKYVMITAKISSYRAQEINQYIVTASMYAAYLTLTLHAYGFGACVIQRNVIWNKKWESLRKRLNISADEQIICMIAVGNLKDTCKVPISHRLNNDEIIHWHC